MGVKQSRASGVPKLRHTLGMGLDASYLHFPRLHLVFRTALEWSKARAPEESCPRRWVERDVLPRTCRLPCALIPSSLYLGLRAQSGSLSRSSSVADPPAGTHPRDPWRLPAATLTHAHLDAAPSPTPRRPKAYYASSECSFKERFLPGRIRCSLAPLRTHRSIPSSFLPTTSARAPAAPARTLASPRTEASRLPLLPRARAGNGGCAVSL